MIDPLEEFKDINLEQVIWNDLVKELKDFHTEKYLNTSKNTMGVIEY